LASCVIGCRINISSATDPVFVHLNQKTSEKALNTCLIWEYTDHSVLFVLTPGSLFQCCWRFSDVSYRPLEAGTLLLCRQNLHPRFQLLWGIFFQIVHKRFFPHPCLFKIGAVVKILQPNFDLSLCLLGHLSRTFLEKCVWQRCQDAPSNCSRIAFTRPLCWSETTKSTP